MISFADTAKAIAPRRTALQEREGKTLQVTAVFVRNGKRDRRTLKVRDQNHSIRTAKRRTHQTVLIQNVRDADSGEFLADHLWFNAGSTWQKSQLQSGDRVRFQSRVIEYRTGYWGPSKLKRLEDPPRIDYKLTPPKNLKVVTSQNRLPMAKCA